MSLAQYAHLLRGHAVTVKMHLYVYAAWNVCRLGTACHSCTVELIMRPCTQLVAKSSDQCLVLITRETELSDIPSMWNVTDVASTGHGRNIIVGH